MWELILLLRSPATAPKKLVDGTVMVCAINEVNDQPVGNPKSKV
jgi:hypothetical protein